MSFRQNESGLLPPLRLAAWLLALVGLFGQLIGAVHLQVVRHVACADHGELVELELDSGFALRVPRPESGVRKDGAPKKSHGHDHCLWSAVRRSQLFRDTFSLDPEKPLSSSVERWLPSASSASLAIALLRLAPKNSPPPTSI